MVRYSFDHWEVDGQIVSGRPLTLTIDRDTVISAIYVEIPLPRYILSVNSTLSGVSFAVIGEMGEMSYVTPWSDLLDEGVYQVEMPETVVDTEEREWEFVQWENGSTNPVRTINLIADTTINAEYVLTPILTGTLKVDTAPVKGEIFINGVSYGMAPINIVIEEDAYTISFGIVAGYVAPVSVTVSVSEGLVTEVLRTYVEEVLPPPPPPPPPPEEYIFPRIREKIKKFKQRFPLLRDEEQ